MTKLLACVILLTALPVYAAELGCVGDCANGTGTYYFSGGGRYEGEWKDGAQTGQGTYYFSNGNRYEGEWKDGAQTGQGTYYFANGDRYYEGELKDGIRDGQGTYYYSNGNRYEGEWKDGAQTGQGTYYFANGDRYEGELKDGIRYGQGTYYYSNGNRYEGEWKDGNQHGQGTYYYSNGNRYEGEWKDGNQHGQGTYNFSNGNRYEGEFKVGYFYGRGTLYYADGDRYEGEWKDGNQHGQGTYNFSNGNRYEGEWKYGKRDGHGTYYFADGDHFKGEWVDGERTKVEVCVLSVCFAVVPWIYDVIDFAVFAAPWAAIVVAAFLIFYGIRRWYESKRSEALRSVAFTLGMSFEDGRDIDATQRFGPFHLFSRWSGGKVRNCLSGTIDGVNVTTFGYEYTVDAGESSTTPQQTVVFFHSNELSLPDFELRARRFFDLVDYFRGAGKDIHIESRPDFSKSYYLRGKDESAIRHVFSRSVLEYFESHKGLSVESRDERLLCYRAESHITDMGFRGARVRPDELKLFIDEGRAVFDLFRMKS